MENTFKFKQFEVVQEKSPHKIGTDSMLLGAWTKGNFNRILDIGTGTGILALMMAQKHQYANITAIEPNQDAIEEAISNFTASPFKNNILGINSSLQQFGSVEKFDLIISNPPYYNATYLSDNESRNQARHTTNLSIFEFYECATELLAKNGRLNVIIPFTEELEHIERAFDNGLFIQEIMHTIQPSGEKKRSLISFGFKEIDPEESEILVKDSHNRYSSEYIELTEEFYYNTLK